jgi:hypothetical protein
MRTTRPVINVAYRSPCGHSQPAKVRRYESLNKGGIYGHHYKWAT